MSKEFVTKKLILALRCTDEATTAGEEYLAEGLAALEAFASLVEETITNIEDQPFLGLATANSQVRRWPIGKTRHYLYYAIKEDESGVFIFMCQTEGSPDAAQTKRRVGSRRTKAVNLETGEQA